MQFNIPNCIVQEAIDCHILTNNGGVGSVESRAREVERRQHHIGEIVSGIIIKEWNSRTKRLPR